LADCADRPVSVANGGGAEVKAIVCERYGDLDNLALSDVEEPRPSAGEVLVDIKAAGVNFPDALLVMGQYQARPELPFIPGSEYAGTVITVGDGVKGISPGDNVFGTSDSFGTFAERIAVPQTSVFPLPKGMPFVAGASLMMAHGTAHHAFKQKANLQPGETVLVLGASGGTGLAAIQIAKVMGAKVIAAASSPEKLAMAKKNGADALIDYSKEDLREAIKQLTDGRGIDVVFDPVGGNAFDTCARIMARGGRLLVIGFASGRIPQFPVNLALVKEFAVIGVFWGSFTRHEPELFRQNLEELIRWHAEGSVAGEVEQKFPLAETPAALKKLIDRQVKGKAVVVNS